MDSPILFLGEWCKLYSKKNIWSTLNHRTATYHWDNRNKFNGDFYKLEFIYEKYLLILAKKLNKIHNKNLHS